MEGLNNKISIEEIEKVENLYDCLKEYEKCEALFGKLKQLKTKMKSLPDKSNRQLENIILSEDEIEEWQILQREISDMLYEYACAHKTKKLVGVQPILAMKSATVIAYVHLRDSYSYYFFNFGMAYRIYWLSCAGRFGSPEAARDLCLIYANVSGETKEARDFNRAREWYRRFCEIGEEKEACELENKLRKAENSCTLIEKVQDKIISNFGWRNYEERCRYRM